MNNTTIEKDYDKILLRDDFISKLNRQWRNGKFQFKVYFDDGTYFTNRDYYQKDVFGKYSGKFAKISIDKDWVESVWMETNLLNSISTSSSIISTPDGNSVSRYESNLIKTITDNQNELDATVQTLEIINKMQPLDRHLLIGHGIVGISMRKLAFSIDRSDDYLRKQYNSALDTLLLVLGIATQTTDNVKKNEIDEEATIENVKNYLNREFTRYLLTPCYQVKKVELDEITDNTNLQKLVTVEIPTELDGTLFRTLELLSRCDTESKRMIYCIHMLGLKRKNLRRDYTTCEYSFGSPFRTYKKALLNFSMLNEELIVYKN